jgi:hypothetical protein
MKSEKFVSSMITPTRLEPKLRGSTLPALTSCLWMDALVDGKNFEDEVVDERREEKRNVLRKMEKARSKTSR